MNISARFFITEPDIWPTRWCKYILQKVLCLLTAQACYREEMDRERERDRNVISVVEHLQHSAR